MAYQILLWPLGGIAYVQPLQRPGATLRGIAAGPLVKGVLMPVLFALFMISSMMGWAQSLPDVHTFLLAIASINGTLLVFNIRPIYPVDGGQIVRSLLWFWVGNALSLMVAAIIGMIGVAGLILYSLWTQSLWLGLISAFIQIYCWGGLRRAPALSRVVRSPRHEGFACPSFKAVPPAGAYWVAAGVAGRSTPSTRVQSVPTETHGSPRRPVWSAARRTP